MNCKQADILISAYIDGELGDAEKKRFEKHIAECSSCKKKLESMHVLSDQMRGLRRIEGDLASRNRVIASVHEQIAKEPAPKPVFVFRIPVYAGWIAASAVVVAVLIALVLMPGQISMGTLGVKSPGSNTTVPDPWENAFIDGMAQYMEMERIQASGTEIFTEPVAGVFVAQPAEPIEGILEEVTGADLPVQG
jgi:anti-sigma factor RsiW